MILPDFIIIGAQKSGTTSLFNWLGSTADIELPRVKEPNFFSDDVSWHRGVQSYSALFEDIPKGKLMGEASVAYTNPDRAALASERIRVTVPDVRLIYLVRHPLARLRSHVAHEVQRGRERRCFQDAVRSPTAPYVRQSLYFTCLEPFLNDFDRQQLCVVRFEDVIGNGQVGWVRVLEHLSLPVRERPTDAFNVTADKRRYTKLMLVLWEHGLLSHVDRFPLWLRRLGKGILTRDPQGSLSTQGSVPDEIQETIWEDVGKLESALGLSAPLWDRAFE